MRPIKVLRRFLEQDPETKEFSSQLGLAQLVDRSESLVRAIEGGRMKMSPKFAKALTEKTGAAKDWLLKPDVQEGNIPSEKGGLLSHSEVKLHIRGPLVIDPSYGSGKSPLLEITLSENIASAVYKSLCHSLEKGDWRLMEEITRVLAAHSARNE